MSAFIPTNRPVPVDLIFSIVVPPSSRGLFSYWLDSLELRVSLGKFFSSPDVVKPRPLIQSDKADDGQPPPYMLSNLRFNVLRSWDSDSGPAKRDQLVLQVMPRTQSGVNMLTLQEASFVLPLVPVIPWDRDCTTRVEMWSSFKNRKPMEWSHGATIKMRPNENGSNV
jgi:hypothetical protein